MKMTYYKLKDLLATYGVEFYFGENKVEFYEQMLYEICGEASDGDTFRFIRMEKDL